MTPEGTAEGSATPCFGKVSKRIGRLLRRLPKSRSWSEGLRLIQRSSSGCSLTLSDCSYTSHLEGQGLTQLDIYQRDGQAEDSTPPGTPGLLDEGTDGIIEVHLRLRGSGTVMTAGQPPEGGAGQDRKAGSHTTTDVVKRLHVSSTTTVSEVIQGLLEKFMVPENPRRFSLYCQKHHDGQDVLQKLSPSEQPLCLQEGAGPDSKPITFILRENESAEVEWQAFSIPELQNFLVILAKEEEERVKQVERKYRQYRDKLCKVLQEAQSKPG